MKARQAGKAILAILRFIVRNLDIGQHVVFNDDLASKLGLPTKPDKPVSRREEALLGLFGMRMPRFARYQEPMSRREKSVLRLLGLGPLPKRLL